MLTDYWIIFYLLLLLFGIGITIFYKNEMLSVICMVLVMLATPFVFVHTLSKPLDLVSVPQVLVIDKKATTEHKVLSYVPIPGKVLYLWVVPKGDTAPRFYSLSWNEDVNKLTQELQDMQEGGKVPIISNLFQPSLEKDKPYIVHPMPQLKAPPKQAPREAPSFNT